MIDIAIKNLHLAGSAQAVTTGVREVNAGTQRSVEDGLAVFNLDGLTERLNG